MATRRWADMQLAQRRMLVVSVAVQFALLAAALIDIRRRPREQIRGPKPVWAGLAFVNFVGPAAYFVLGRKRHAARPAEGEG
ncbi:MAG TPA: hypothetical protein DHU96_20380 [Actinobacteria bacterium]|nr:hypothetical protein [Actinomycetota bacterium]